MRKRSCFLFSLLLAAACGGSGGSGALPALGATLEGQVVEVDGQAADRSGVRVEVVETGQDATTGVDGSFDLGEVPTGDVTLRFDDDDRSMRRVDGIEDGDRVSVRASLSGGDLVEFSSSGTSSPEAEVDLLPVPGASIPGVEGEVEVEQETDRDKLEIEAENLPQGTVVDFFLDGVLIATLAAIDGGEAELEIDTGDGDTLPLGAAGVDDLAGRSVEVRLAATGETLLTGEVPALQMSFDEGENDDNDGDEGDNGDEDNDDDGRTRGRAELTAHVPDVEGHVEIRDRPDQGEQRFKMEADDLAPGTAVAFLMEDPPNSGTFVRIGTAVADGEGEAEINTQDGLPMPLGVADVSELIGREVRVVRDDGTDELLLSGFVPALVAD